MESSENQPCFQCFLITSGRVENNQFAWSRLILEAKFDFDP